MLKVDKLVSPDYARPKFEHVDGVTRIVGCENSTTYTILLVGVPVYVSQSLEDVIKYVQELNFEASLLLLNLRTMELNER
jgi:hypothetical protein